MADCPHGMPTRGSCIDCMDEEGLGPSLESRAMREEQDEQCRVFESRFISRCRGCGKLISEGEEVAYFVDIGTVVHNNDRCREQRLSLGE